MLIAALIPKALSETTAGRGRSEPTIAATARAVAAWINEYNRNCTDGSGIPHRGSPTGIA